MDEILLVQCNGDMRNVRLQRVGVVFIGRSKEEQVADLPVRVVSTIDYVLE